MKDLRKTLAAAFMAALGLGAFTACSLTSGSDSDESGSAKSTLASPVISPAAGDYSEGFKEVSISCDSDADIFYTTDGTEPSSQSNRYTGTFKIIGSKTVKAVAVSGKSSSAVTTSVFNLNAGKSQSQLGVVTGTVNLSSSLSETITSSLKDATIYIYSDDLPSVVKTCKVGETYYFDGLDTSKSYSFYFSNVEPGVVYGTKSSSSRAAQETTYDESGTALVAKEIEVTPEEGSGITVDVDLTATGKITGVAKRYDVTGAEESDHGGTVVYIPGTSFSAYTDSAGNFTMSGIPQGSHTIRAQYSGYSYAEKSDVLLQATSSDAPETTIEEEFALTFGKGIVKGSVVLSDATSSSAFSGIDIVITDTTNKYTYSASTTSAGAFSITDVYPGTYTAEISKDGYETAAITDISVVGASVTSIPVTSLQVIGGSVSGSVAIDGKTDLSGISILAKSEEGKSFFAITDSTGAFSWEKVSPGTYTVSASYPGYRTSSVSGIVVTIGGNIENVLIPQLVESTYSITGKVFLEGLLSGFEGTSVLVSDTTTLKQVASTVTGTDGTFSVSDIDAGDYLLTVSRDGYLTSNSTVVSVGTTSIATAEDITLQNALGLVKGNVKMESASDNAGIAILVINQSDSSITYSTVTDSDGNYSIGGVSPGSYKVQATKSGFNNGYSDAFTVTAGQTSSASDISLSISVRSIYGTVTLEGKTDYSGIKITATNTSNTSEIYSALSNSSGVYALSGMTPGEYILSYSFDGYVSVTSSSVSLESDSSLSLDAIELKKATGKIAGIVNLEGCTDHSGILVSLVGTDYTYTTQSNGAYEFSVPSGNYPGGVRFEKTDYQLTAKADTITVLTDSTYGVLTVEMKATANTLKGKVDLAGSDDDSGITVTVDEYPELTAAATASDGSWTLEHVPVNTEKYVTVRFARENTPDVTSQIIVSPSDYIDLGTLEMIPNAANISGHVYLTDLTDHQNITVTVTTDGKDDVVVKTASDGAFTVTNILSTGSHTVTFSKSGWDSQSITVSDLEPLEDRVLAESVYLVDTTAPVLDSVTINSGANYSNSSKVHIDLTSTENGSGNSKMAVQLIRYVDGVEQAAYPVNKPWQAYQAGFDYDMSELGSTIFTGNGTYTLVVTLKDLAGNESESVKKSITVTDLVTTVSGVLTDDLLHWTKEKSPYLVEADTLVGEGKTLVIDPGVEVRFAGNYSISVSGEIEARGTSDEKILFTRSDDYDGTWNAIAISGGSTSYSDGLSYISGNILEYCELDYGTLNLGEGTYVNHCSFSNAGTYVSVSSNSVIMNSVMNNGLRLNDSSALVLNNKINSYLRIWSYGSLRFKNNTVENISNDWVLYRNVNVTKNKFINSHINLYDLSGNFSANAFEDSPTTIVSTTNSYSSDKSFNLTGNYWGKSQTEELETKGTDANISFVSDYYDNFSYTKLDVSNYLTEEPENAGYLGDDFSLDTSPEIYISLKDGASYSDDDGNVSYTVGFYDLGGISLYRLYLNDVLLESGSSETRLSKTLDVPYMAAGSYTLKAYAQDTSGNETTKTVSFTVNRTDSDKSSLAGTSWDSKTGQPLKDERTTYLWHLDASGSEADNTDATISSYTNAIDGFGGGSASYISTSGSIDFDVSSNAFTVEYWIKGSNSSDKPYLNIEKSSALDIYSDYIALYYANGDSVSSNLYSSSRPAGDGEWHYVAKVYGTTYVATYIDGVLVYATDGISITLNNSTEKLSISMNRADAVDEIRISSTARSSDEIASYYKAAKEVLDSSYGSLGGIIY